ncbi:MAG: hypothetical protein N2746_02350 [Deltaproteobacteria bacterium]|nr:hypothetical protein [Deltaproteobacteria bacterium]
MKQDRKEWFKRAKSRIKGIAQKEVINSVINSLTLPEKKIKNYLSERNIPVEFINFIIQQVNNSRKNITELIKDEIKKYISALDITNEIHKILSKMVIEIKTEIRFVPIEKSKYKSNIKSSVNLRFDEEKEET